jgi:tyrosine-protein kinase Etk/Wzc
MPSLKPIKPQKTQALVLSTLLGLFLGIGLAMLRRALNQNVEDPRLIESRLGLPVVVTIPHSDIQEKEYNLQGSSKGKGSRIMVKDHPEDLAVESLRSLRTSLSFTMMDARNRVIMISGPSPGIGKSFVSCNFAGLLAQSATHTRVLLVDGDMRRGNIHQYFGLKNRKNGLSEILSGQMAWRDAVQATDIPGLEVITTGTLPPNPSELLMSGRFTDFISEISDEYNLTIIDAPPVLAVTDPVIIGRQVGSVLLLVKAKAHPMDEIRNAVSRFEIAGIKLKGCIFNDVLAVNLGYKYFRYAYHYAYKK